MYWLSYKKKAWYLRLAVTQGGDYDLAGRNVQQNPEIVADAHPNVEKW